MPKGIYERHAFTRTNKPDFASNMRASAKILTRTAEQRVKQLANYKVDSNGCWLWQGHCESKAGYGQVSYNGKSVPAHRMFYAELVGPIPQGICVLHKCDVPQCVNPEHLFLGTQKDNTQDMISKGRKGVNPKNIIITYDGLSLNINQWAEYLGVKPQSLYSRIARGWDAIRAIAQPVDFSASQRIRYKNTSIRKEVTK